MKIAVAGTIDTPIRASSSAGTEIWTYNFCQELVRQGHKVTLFADSSSKIDGEVVSVCRNSDLSEPNGQISKSKLAIFTFEQILQIAKRQDAFDLIHISIFSFPYALPAMNLLVKPAFITVHGSGMNYHDAKMFFKLFPTPNYIFASKSFASSWPQPKKSKIILHGIKIEDFCYSATNDGYFFWMSRISPEKRVEDAIAFAKKTGHKLVIAGPIRNKEYYDRTVKPNLNKKILYVGELKLQEKIRYYQQAKAFLFTARPPEAFGLVVIESLACGTPVIAHDVGATAEIIENGVNGFILKSSSIKEMINVSNRVDSIKRRDCHDSVKIRFDMKCMISQYLDYYRHCLGHEQ
jgi:glycosyltransferase involved in cell wall biosynthesis